MRCGHVAVEGRDAVPVRVGGGLAEKGGDALFELFADEVLEALGFVVELFDGVVEDFVEEGFEQAMVADDFERAAAAAGGEDHAAVALIAEQRLRLRGEALQHVGGGGWGDVEVFGDLGVGDLAGVVSAKGVNGLDVVVDRLALARSHRRGVLMCRRRHTDDCIPGVEGSGPVDMPSYVRLGEGVSVW